MWPVCTFIFLRFYQSASTQLSLLTTNQILEENHGKKNRLYNQQNIRRLTSSASFWFQPHRKGQWSIHSDGAIVSESGGGGELSTHSSKQLPNKRNLRRQDTRSTRPQTWLVWGETLLTVTKLTQWFSSAGKRAVSFSQPALQSCFLFVCCRKRTTKQRV